MYWVRRNELSQQCAKYSLSDKNNGIAISARFARGEANLDRVAVVSDTITQIPQELATAFNVELLPLYIVLDGKAYPETKLDLAWYDQ